MATQHNSISATIANLQSIRPTGLIAIPEGSPDEALLRAWNGRQTALATIEGRGTFFDGEQHSPTELSVFDAMEEAMRHLRAKTIEGVLAKLWLAMSHMGDGFTEATSNLSDTVRRVDVDALEGSEVTAAFDFAQEVVFDAIKAVTSLAQSAQ